MRYSVRQVRWNAATGGSTCILGEALVLLALFVSLEACAKRPEESVLQHSVASSSGDAARAQRAAGERSDSSHRVAVDTASATRTVTPTATPQRCMVPTQVAVEVAAAAARCPSDPDFGGPQLSVGTLRFPHAASAPPVVVEIADTPRTRERGLMYRRAMDENAGMLFDMGLPQRQQSFWMRNTCIALDMLFIADDGFIAGVLRNVPTMNEASRTVPCPVRYVLELNAGWTAKHGVEAGQWVELPRMGAK